MRANKVLGTALLLVSMGASIASVSAEVLVDYQFNDADGTSFSDAVNDGTSGNFSYTSYVVTNGSLRIGQTPGSNPAIRAGFLSPVTSGVITTDVRFDTYDLSGNNGTDGTYFFKMGVEATDGIDAQVGLRIQTNTTSDVYIYWNQGEGNERGDLLSASSLSSLSLRSTLDLDNQLYSAYYSVDDWATSMTIVDSVSVAFTNGIDNAFWGIESGDIGASDYVDVDYFTIQTIPEPATLGLIGMVGAGILFIRRRFMI